MQCSRFLFAIYSKFQFIVLLIYLVCFPDLPTNFTNIVTTFIIVFSVFISTSFILHGSSLFCSSAESHFLSPKALQHWEYIWCPLFLIVTFSYSLLFLVNYLSKEGLLILSIPVAMAVWSNNCHISQCGSLHWKAHETYFWPYLDKFWSANTLKRNKYFSVWLLEWTVSL